MAECVNGSTVAKEYLLPVEVKEKKTGLKSENLRTKDLIIKTGVIQRRIHNGSCFTKRSVVLTGTAAR